MDNGSAKKKERTVPSTLRNKRLSRREALYFLRSCTVKGNPWEVGKKGERKSSSLDRGDDGDDPRNGRTLRPAIVDPGTMLRIMLCLCVCECVPDRADVARTGGRTLFPA